MQQFRLNSTVVLMGYAGSGKSTVGKILAEKLLVKHLDLDDFIVEKEQKSISDIFKERGEIYFRKLEHQLLADVLSWRESVVFSLGGGTPCYANNADIIANSGHHSFYLQANVSTLVTRLADEIQTRPLLANVDDLPSYIGQHLFEREHFYRTAKHVVATSGKTTEQIAADIVEILSQVSDSLRSV
jgi:shikimate kinase